MYQGISVSRKQNLEKMGEKPTNQEICWTGCGRRVNVAGRLVCWPRRMGGRVFDRPSISGSSNRLMVIIMTDRR